MSRSGLPSRTERIFWAHRTTLSRVA
jgi:hypothetical protein